jgi:TolB-like protein/Flp pilus assembly protein TadD
VNGSTETGPEFLTRLRRRKVVQWGLVYVAGAWGFLQGLEYVSEAFEWPTQVRQIALLALLIGLPVVLVLAWYHGDRGQQRVTTPEFAILTLLLLLGGGALWYYQHASDAGSDDPATTTNTSKPVASAVVSDTRPSIAVLPYENRSDVQKDAFFVDGIHDDILTQLSKVSSLKVISRTSVEQFRDTKLSMKAIADQLGVTKILEGGVQRAGDRVRINVQLIDAATDTHLWAENYDRELTVGNLFAIQSEVAAAIAATLETTLTSAEKQKVNAIPTQSLEAWQNYQLGTQRLARRTSAALTEAQAFFQKAIDIDPRYAPAYAGLADAVWLTADYGGKPLEPAVKRAEELLDQALRLDPNLAEAHATLAKFAQDKRDFARAEAGYRRAIELKPNYPTVYHWYAQLLALQSRDAEALQSIQTAATLDPLAAPLQVNLAMWLDGAGRSEAALDALDNARNIDPTSPLPYSESGAILAAAFGQLDDAVPFMQKAIELDTAGSAYMKRLAQLYLDLGDVAQAGLWLDRATEDGSANAVRSYRYLYLGGDNSTGLRPRGAQVRSARSKSSRVAS